MKFKLYFLWCVLLCCFVSLNHAKPLKGSTLGKRDMLADYRRHKRQFSLNLGATHEDGYGTDVNAEAIANLWRSQSGNTKLDGSASYNQHFGGLAGDGRDYKLKLKVVFTR